MKYNYGFTITTTVYLECLFDVRVQKRDLTVQLLRAQQGRDTCGQLDEQTHAIICLLISLIAYTITHYHL